MTPPRSSSNAQEDLFGVEPTRALLDTLLTSSRLYRTTADYGVTSNSETYLANFVGQNTTVGDLDIYQVMRAAGQVETLLGLGAQSGFAKR